MNPKAETADGPIAALPARLGALFDQATRHLEAGRLEEAKQLFLQTLATDVRHAPSLFGLGTVAQRAADYDVAAKMMRRAIAADGANAEYHFALGVSLQAQGNLNEALGEFRRVVELNPRHLQGRFRAGNVQQLQGKLDEAIATYEEILSIEPNSSHAEFNIGNVLRLQGKLAAARDRYQRALKIDADSVDAKWNLSLLDLLEGDYASGWALYEVRQQRPTPNLRNFQKPQWRGQPLEGKRILLHAEQGLGDTLQFLRFVPMVVAAGGLVLLDVPKEIRRLAAEIEGLAGIIVTGESIPEHDFQSPLMSLPLAFGTRVETIPARVPYLRVPEDARRTAARLKWPANGARVGLVWGATTRSFEDSDRSIPLALFEAILATQGTHFYSLQLGPHAEQLKALKGPITDLHGVIHDFADTAALASHLDLVITVDTSVAHIVGALGKPTWVLLPFASDWRWLTQRRDSPWYPTAKLFRQIQARDWAPVLEQVRGDLVQLVRESAR